MDMEFFHHLMMLLGLMIGFTTFKVANCSPFVKGGEKFDVKTLFLGITRNLLVMVGATVVFMVSSIYGSDLLVLQFGKTQVTMQSAIDLTTLTILTVYGVKYVKNLAKFAGVDDKINVVPISDEEDCEDEISEPEEIEVVETEDCEDNEILKG